MSSDDRPKIASAWAMVEQAKAEIDNLDAGQVAEVMSDDDVVIVDIRDFREVFQTGKIPGSVHAPRGMLEFWIDPSSEYYRDVFTPEKRFVLYCAAGGRSALAAKAMKDMGYPDVGHLETGFAGWKESGAEIEDVRDDAKWKPARD